MRRRGSKTADPTGGCRAPEPEPVDGCGVCAALVEQRVDARKGTGSLTDSECDREMRAHPHRRAGDFT